MNQSLKKCKIYMQVLLAVKFLSTSVCFAKDCNISRKPANFVPDDDLIVVPIVIEENIYDEFNKKHAPRLKAARKQMIYWQQQEQYAKDYGLENTGIVNLPTQEQKEQFLQRNYLRFISKDLEKSANNGIKDSWDSFTADEEIDAIKAIEEHEKVIVKAKRNKGRKVVQANTSVGKGKDKLRFGMQVRPEIGLAKFTVKSNGFYAKAWIGINGNQELTFEKDFKSTQTSFFTNYYIEQQRMLASVDQRLAKNLKLRLTHQKDIAGEGRLGNAKSEDNILKFMYYKPF